MKKSQFLISILQFFILLPNAFALVCPEKKNIPLCPKNGITLLDETYPTQSFLISNAAQVESKESVSTTQNFINKIIKNYDYENVPQIMLAIQTTEEFNEFIEATKKVLIYNKINPNKIKKIMDQLTHVPISNYPWQQDWFESFVDLKTGSPVVRPMQSYMRVERNAGETLTKSGEKCNIKIGNQLKDDPSFYTGAQEKANKSFGSGEMGGNIEGAPGGFCMIGDNVGKSLALQICKEESNIIQLQTSWLEVGHVDEIFKIIPTQFNDGRPRECEFSLMSASPKKAIELMKNPKLGQIPFADINNPDSDPSEMRSSRADLNHSGNFLLCQYIEESIKNKPDSKKMLPAVRSVLIKYILPDEVRADEDSMQEYIFSIMNDPKKMASFKKSCHQNIDKVTNFELQAVMQTDSDFNNLNTAIDQSIQKDRELIKRKILTRLPQCTKWYNELEVPNLFYGDYAIEKADGKLELSRPGVANSFLPNPTNSVLMNKTIAFPDTGNRLFNNYLSEEMTKRKMKSDFIATWDYAHIGGGNIHCASHSIPHCSPNTKGK